MKRFFLFAVIVASLLIGCQSKEAKLVGTWKAKQQPAKPSGDLGDVAKASFFNMISNGMTVEFTKEGTFKMTQTIGSVTGNYTWEGEMLKLKFNTFAPQNELKLRFGEGNTLETVTSFQSDPKVVFEKQ